MNKRGRTGAVYVKIVENDSEEEDGGRNQEGATNPRSRWIHGPNEHWEVRRGDKGYMGLGNKKEGHWYIDIRRRALGREGLRENK